MKEKALRWMPAAMMLLAAFGVVSAPALAGPVFILPGGAVTPGNVVFPPPGPLVHVLPYAIHLFPIGPVPLPPGGTVGPHVYGDFVPNPLDPHHWEIELNNTNAVETAWNVKITSPGGDEFLGSVTLSPNWSAYWDVHYADVPEVGGLWTLLATNPLGGTPGLQIDSSVIEYNQPLFGVGPSGPWFAGPAGAGPGGRIGVLLHDIPLADISVTPFPEPASLTLLALGGLGWLWMLRRRARNG